MPKIGYLDTNIFDHILHKKCGVTTEDEVALRNAIKLGNIFIPLSLLNFEEALSAWEKNPNEAINKIKLISDLVDWQKMLKSPDELLADDIKSFAKSNNADVPFFIDFSLQSELRKLQNPNKRNIAKLLDVIRDVRKEKEHFRDINRELRFKLLDIISNLGKIPDYHDYWERFSLDFTRGFIEGVGLTEEYKYRLIDKLLGIRSVSLCVGYSLSYIYGQGFDKKRIPDLGDSRDMKHAVLASASDIFVTHDGNLREIMQRIPIENFEVCSLHELLEKI
jgi:hypothetical protein